MFEESLVELLFDEELDVFSESVELSVEVEPDFCESSVEFFVESSVVLPVSDCLLFVFEVSCEVFSLEEVDVSVVFVLSASLL